MDIPINNKELVAIEYPGTVNNVSKLVDHLGGVEKVNAVFHDPSKRLELLLRPEDPFSKPCHGDKYITTAFMLEIIKKTKKSTGEVSYFLKYHGSFKNIYKFKSICDFQLLPISYGTDKHKADSLLPKLIPHDLHLSEWFEEDVPLFITPLAFSRFDTPQSGYVEVNKPKVPVKSDVPLIDSKLIGRNRTKRNTFTVISSFQNHNIPKVPKKEAIETLQHHPTEIAIKERLDVLFEERKIWTKNALVTLINCDKSRLKYALTSSAYYCSNGPWRTLWIKFGYDPRKDPKSKIYQVMDFRINQSIKIDDSDRTRAIEYYMPYTKLAPQKTTVRIPMIDTNHFVEASTSDNKEKKLDEAPQYMLVPGRMPNVRQCYFQLCDVLYDEVQQLIHQNDGKEQFCREKDGWCDVGILDRCREIILNDIKNTSKCTEENI